MLPTGTQKPIRQRRRSAFTLVELIIVMALLGGVLAVSAPALSSFFRSRTLKDETRRFLALTELARQESISLGVPMVVFIDTSFRRYGLEPKVGYVVENARVMEFQVADGLELVVEQRALGSQNLATIEFLPDGSLDPNSLYEVIIKRESDAAAFFRIARTLNGLAYEERSKAEEVVPVNRNEGFPIY